MAIPVTVITGFLGAGKSTLLDRWLAESPRDETAVIINEQGDVGIDGALMANRVSRLREITGGCICCTTQVALDAALNEFARSDPPPKRIFVETSGAASPAGVIRALTRGDSREQLRLDGIVTVLDASRARRTLEFELTIEQLGFADIVLMSHITECPEAEQAALEQELAALEQELALYAPGAVVARANKGHIQTADGSTLLTLLAARGNVLRVLPEGDAPASRHGIDAVSMVHDGELDESVFLDWVEEALGAIEARLLRVKGILAIHGVEDRVIIQGVGAAVGVTLGAPWAQGARTSRLVVLGLELDEAALLAGFASCTIS